jgi:DNA-binding CsgD family transcriptional regulator/class 3 adenylate cyclase
LTRLNAQIDIRDQLPRIQAPTLILHRNGDRLVTIDNGRYLAEHIPDASLRVLPGDDHLPFIGDQDHVLAEIEDFLTGSNRRSELDLTLTTILATEIVAAAETAARLGNRRWNELWLEQRTRMRTLIARHGGREIFATPEGSIAIFDQPTKAIDCARAVIDGTRRSGLHARAGLHIGEVVLTGEEVVGVAVHIAQLVARQAGADDIVASGTAHDLAVGQSSQFELVGNQVFPGLLGEWRIYRLAQDEPSASRARLSVDATPHRPLSNLSRREREIASLLALGLANRQIADELAITVATVERHVANILIKLGFRSRAQVAAWAVEQGLLQASSSVG